MVCMEYTYKTYNIRTDVQTIDTARDNLLQSVTFKDESNLQTGVFLENFQTTRQIRHDSWWDLQAQSTSY